ncbi:hypothetical protein GDO78_000198 [Eleutherodactylus coqui]|uniref:Uncharacterized protein n=1 Tax=Eleutherodactylus coqui TaxID=57060 RepID=A0A8J6KH86_ELECQ|nr:hypothetical protein GDO78_000198 [Eleutherodactylus coqui]
MAPALQVHQLKLWGTKLMVILPLSPLEDKLWPLLSWPLADAWWCRPKIFSYEAFFLYVRCIASKCSTK